MSRRAAAIRACRRSVSGTSIVIRARTIFAMVPWCHGGIPETTPLAHCFERLSQSDVPWPVAWASWLALWSLVAIAVWGLIDLLRRNR
jgi:hypothetical protein